MPKSLSVEQITEAISQFTTEDQIQIRSIINSILSTKEKLAEQELKLLKGG